MRGWQLFVKAVTLVTDNLGLALRVSAVPFLLVVATSLYAFSTAPEALLSGGTGMGVGLPPEAGDADGAVDAVGAPVAAFSGAALLSALATLLVTMWIAVAWHRATLLEDAPDGWVPRFDGGLVLGYLGRSILLGLIVVLVTAATGFVLGVVLIPLMGAAGAGLIGTAAFFVAMILFYRLGPVLPAGAVEKPIGLGEAWRATSGATGPLVVLALLTAALSFLLQLPAGVGGLGLLTVVYYLVVQWITVMLGVSALTVIYGHLVEGRPL